MKLSKETRDQLHKDLIKLGDMMGDGLHYEPDGKWISKEYRRVAKALGYIKPTKKQNNTVKINEAMIKRLKEVKCPNCKQDLKQTRSGSMKAECTRCGSRYKLLKHG